MKNKKILNAFMAGILSAAVLMTGTPALAAEFSDDAAAQEMGADVQTQNLEVEGQALEEQTPAADEQGEAAENEAPAADEQAEAVENLFEAEDGEEEAEVFSSATMRASSGVAISATNFPDKNFRTYVSTLDTDKSKTLSTTEIKAVKKIDITGKKISNLKGIERFTYLTELYASNNSLKTVNLTKNTKLTYVNVSKNKLTGTLDLSKCTALVTIVCANNSLTKVTMPNVKYLKKLDFIDVSHNKFTTQANAGLGTISAVKLPDLSEINASYNSITSFNCSGFEGILDISNNKITSFTGGDEGFQAGAIYMEGSGNTLSKTSKVDFATLGNRVPQRFSCNAAVQKKVVMVAPRLTAKLQSGLNQINLSLGSSSDYASYKLERKEGSGSYRVLSIWHEGQLEDPEFGDDGYVDKDVAANKTYTYRLTATVNVQNKSQVSTPWSASKTVTVKTVPGKVNLTVKSTKKGVAAISWGKIASATGYDVYYGTSKSKQNLKVVAGTTKLSVNKTKLKSGTTYYFKARAYKSVNGKKVYGAYSSVKSVKVK